MTALDIVNGPDLMVLYGADMDDLRRGFPDEEMLRDKTSAILIRTELDTKRNYDAMALGRVWRFYPR